MLIVIFPSQAYPLFGSEPTFIRRLEAARLVEQGELRGNKQPAGGLLSLDDVTLRLRSYADIRLPSIDERFTQEIKHLLRGRRRDYSLSVLDLTIPDHPRYAEHGGEQRRNPGSVGKVIIATGLFQALADIYPNDIEARERILRDTVVTADQFIISDHHRVRFWDAEKNRLRQRPLQKGDQGSLWEYLDWMLSASSNAAASTVLKQAMLIKHFGREYPVNERQVDQFFNHTKKQELTKLLIKTIQTPLTRNRLDLEKLRQGSFFTKRGKKLVPGTNSYATTRELMKLMLKIEQGQLVDEFSSLEMKRLLYMTERRIRYASHPALENSAVYFKSGSLYICGKDSDPDFVCKSHHGNMLNLMNSVAIIETRSGEGATSQNNNLHYIVTLTSNVLKENAAVAHQTLAMRIHRLIEKRQLTPTASESGEESISSVGN